MIRPLAPFTATLEDMAQLVGASLHGASLSFTGITHIDSEVQLELGARERGWREADSAIDKATARFGRASVRPGRLIKPEKESDEA